MPSCDPRPRAVPEEEHAGVARDSRAVSRGSPRVRTYEGRGEQRRRAATVGASSILSQKEKPMTTAATRPRTVETLHVAFELGNSEWSVAMTPSLDRPPLVRTVPARELAAVDATMALAKAHFHLRASCPVASCYEAGRDGFWLHRYLTSRGIANVVVDSSSIEVNRRRRRAKTDRLDAQKLVTMLIRAVSGEAQVWSVLRVPAVADEDHRQVHRELLAARRDRARHVNRIKGLLASQGVALPTLRALPRQLAATRLWDGTRVPPRLGARLAREWAAVSDDSARIRLLVRERRALLHETSDPAIAQVRQLHQLRGV